MTRREQLGLGLAGRRDEPLATPTGEWRELLSDASPVAEPWQEFATRGGFPTPALQLSSAADRGRWSAGCVQTFLKRDLQMLSAISALPDFRRLMRIAALRIGQMINQTEIGRDAAIVQATAHRYLNLLETSYIMVRVRPHYAVAGRSACPLPLNTMLRVYFLQQWFDLSDPAAEDMVYDSESLRPVRAGRAG